MRSAVFFAALVAAVSAQLRIETPTSLIECQPAKLMWTGGTAPYYPAVIPGGQPAAAALKTFPQTSDTTITWTVDLAAGQEVTLRITDAQGNINYAQQVPIQAGSSKTCLSAAVAVTSGGGNSTVASASGAASSASRSAGATGAVAGVASAAASSASSAASGASSAARSAASSASGMVSGAMSSASSVSGSATRAPASASSSAAAYLGAEPKMIGGLLGVAAGVFGVLAM